MTFKPIHNADSLGELEEKVKRLSAELLRIREDGTKKQDDDESLITDEEAMKFLRVDKRWLRDHTTRTEPIIPHIRMGKEIRYSRRALIAWAHAQTETGVNRPRLKSMERRNLRRSL
jgi:hypothetical protein